MLGGCFDFGLNIGLNKFRISLGHFVIPPGGKQSAATVRGTVFGTIQRLQPLADG